MRTRETGMKLGRFQAFLVFVTVYQDRLLKFHRDKVISRVALISNLSPSPTIIYSTNKNKPCEPIVYAIQI